METVIKIVVILVFLGVIIWKMWPSIWSVISVFFYDDVRLNKSSELDDEEYKKLALGAPYASQQSAYQNTLALGIGSKLQEIAFEAWGIDSIDSAIETLDYLVKNGHRKRYPLVVKALNLKTPDEQKKFLEENTSNEEEFYEMLYSLNNLSSCVDELIGCSVIKSKEDLAKKSATAWDTGRIVFVTRMCYDLKLIPEVDAWEYIDKASAIAKKEFKSWKDYGDSYVIGRAMWGGLECNNGGMASIVNDLLKDEKSPWKKFEF